jgi:uncharacterized protein YeaO (DUF488 family)
MQQLESAIEPQFDPLEFYTEDELNGLGRDCRYCENCIEEGIDFYGDPILKCKIHKFKIMIFPYNQELCISAAYKKWTYKDFYPAESYIGYCSKFQMKPLIRIDCYLSVLKKYRKLYPNAHFEVITRQSFGEIQGDHILSPSWNLLKKSKKEKWNFEQYSRAFIKEMDRNPNAKKYMSDLKKKIAAGITVFLVCVEKNPLECHRSIIKKIMELKKNAKYQ